MLQQYQIKLRHLVKTDKNLTKKPEVAICTAVNYTDAEAKCAEWIKAEAFHDPSDVVISKIQNHEILGYKKDEDVEKNWWKARTRYFSESEKGKVSVFYVRYLVYADNIEKALELVMKKEDGAAMQGEIINLDTTIINYMLIPEKEFASV